MLSDLPVYIEISISLLLLLLCIVGNGRVMKRSVTVETKFARQIMTVFFGLAISDMLLCNIRVPILIYGLYAPDEGRVACIIWQLSSALLGIIMWTNLLVGIQRLLIIYNFPLYRRCFTLSTTIKCLIGIWILNCVAVAGLSQGIGWEMAYKNSSICKYLSFDISSEITYRVVFISIVQILPLMVTCICHVWIVCCIVRLTRPEGADDGSAYKRINITVIFRTVMLVVCFSPYLFGSLVNPWFNVFDTPHQRYLEYLICLQSVASPFITLGDSDFRDDNRKHQGIQRSCLSGFYGKRRAEARLAASVITSADLRTNRQSE